jgi:hypothetical protein
MKKVALFVPLGVAALLFLLVLIADAWLESRAGRRELENALESSLGMPVQLQGDFDISLLPALGVSGTDLSIGSNDTDAPFVQIRDYQVAVKLLPLINGELSVLSFSAAGGLLDPARYPGAGAKARSAGKSEFRLPEIERLLLEDIRIILPGQGDNSVSIDRLELDSFRAGEPSALTLELSLLSSAMTSANLSLDSKLLVESGLRQLSLEIDALNFKSEALILHGINGRLSWQMAGQLLDGQLSWQEPGLGSARLTSRLSIASNEGHLEFSFTGEGQSHTLDASLNFERREKGLYFPEISASFGAQQTTGNGCYLAQETSSLHLLMASDYIDVEKLDSLIPGDSGMASGLGDDLPVELNVKLAVQEIHAAGAIARNVEISLGRQPDCSLLLD